MHPSPVGPSQSHQGHSHDTSKVTLLATEWGEGKAAQDKAVSKRFSQDANTGLMTSGRQFTQSKHKNVYKFAASPVNPNPITDFVLLCTLL